MVVTRDGRNVPLPLAMEVVTGFEKLGSMPLFNRYHDNHAQGKCCMLFALHAYHEGPEAVSYDNPHITMRWAADHYGLEALWGLRDGWDMQPKASGSYGYDEAWECARNIVFELLDYYRTRRP